MSRDEGSYRTRMTGRRDDEGSRSPEWLDAPPKMNTKPRGNSRGGFRTLFWQVVILLIFTLAGTLIVVADRAAEYLPKRYCEEWIERGKWATKREQTVGKYQGNKFDFPYKKNNQSCEPCPHSTVPDSKPESPCGPNDDRVPKKRNTDRRDDEDKQPDCYRKPNDQAPRGKPATDTPKPSSRGESTGPRSRCQRPADEETRGVG